MLFNSRQEVTHSVFVGVNQNDEIKLGRRIRRGGLSEWIWTHSAPIVVENTAKDKRANCSDFLTRFGHVVLFRIKPARDHAFPHMARDRRRHVNNAAFGMREAYPACMQMQLAAQIAPRFPVCLLLVTRGGMDHAGAPLTAPLRAIRLRR